MTNEAIIRLYNGLMAVQHLPGAKFAYNVSRNIGILKPVGESIEKALVIPEGYHKYEEEKEKRRKEICISNARKDSEGKPKSKNNNGRSEYDIEDTDKCTAELNAMEAAIKEEYKELIEEMAKGKQDYIQFLQAENDGQFQKLYRLTQEDLPQGITPAQLLNIMEILD